MYYKDHNPRHFHARYGDYEVIMYMETGVIEGKFPKRALNFLYEWSELHKTELIENWKRAQNGEILKHIEPLE